MPELAEFIPAGDSIAKLTAIALRHNIVVLAGLFEKDANDNFRQGSSIPLL